MARNGNFHWYVKAETRYCLSENGDGLRGTVRSYIKLQPCFFLVRSFCGIIYATAGFCTSAEDSNAFFRRMWRIGDEVPRNEILTAG